jgi:hypothetical protein
MGGGVWQVSRTDLPYFATESALGSARGIGFTVQLRYRACSACRGCGKLQDCDAITRRIPHFLVFGRAGWENKIPWQRLTVIVAIFGEQSSVDYT